MKILRIFFYLAMAFGILSGCSNHKNSDDTTVKQKSSNNIQQTIPKHLYSNKPGKPETVAIYHNTPKYGEASFTNIKEPNIKSIVEKNDTVYVLFNNNDQSDKNLYMSIGKPDNWISTDKIIKNSSDPLGTNYKIFGKGIYYVNKNNGVLYLKKVNDNGTVQTNKLMSPDKGTRLDYFELRSTDGDVGTLICQEKGTQIKSYLYFPSNGNITLINDQSKLISSYIQVVGSDNITNFLYDPLENALYFHSSQDPNGIQKINIKTGKPLYNEEGKVKITKSDDDETASSYIIGDQQKHQFLFQAITEKNGRMTKVYIYDDQLYPLYSSDYLNFDTLTKNYITTNKNEIHFWQVVTKDNKKPTIRRLDIIAH